MRDSLKISRMVVIIRDFGVRFSMAFTLNGVGEATSGGGYSVTMEGPLQ